MARRKKAAVSLFAAGTMMQVIRGMFAVGERIAPRMMAPIGQRLWFHVPPAPPYPRRDRGFDSGELLDVRLNGRHLATHAWGSGPTVLLVHGWSGWWQQLGLYVRPLVDAGYRVVAFDMPSHGDSGRGRFGRGYSGIPDFADAVEAVARQVADGHVHAAVTHSAGSVGFAIAMTRGIRADRVVFISPSVSGDDQVDFVAQRLGWGPRTRQAGVDRREHRFALRMSDYSLEKFAEYDLDLPPALFFHDWDDDSTPPHGTMRLAKMWTGSRIVNTNGFGHFRIMWEPDVIRQVTEFVDHGPGAAG